MITDDDDSNNEDNEVDESEEEPEIKCEVKEEVEDVESGEEWNDLAPLEAPPPSALPREGPAAEISNVEEIKEEIKSDDENQEKSQEQKDEEWRDSMEYCALKRNITRNKRGRFASKQEKTNTGRSSTIDYEEWREKMESINISRNKRGRFCSKQKRSPLPEAVQKFWEGDGSESEPEGAGGSRSVSNVQDKNSEGEEAPVRKKAKRKDEDWNESMEFCTERVNVSRNKGIPRSKRKNVVPPMPELFSSLEEFTEYLEKRVDASINAALEENEDPRLHQHFYLAIHQCLEVALKLGLVAPSEVDDIWKKYDDLAAQKYESSEKKAEEVSRKKKRMVGRHYVRVPKVRLRDNQYKEMLNKTRRIKTLFVRDAVLKSVGENNGENKIINDLKVRREFFNQLLDVPGATSKTAVLSSVKTLWKHLVHGTKDNWSKYLTNKERVLEKRRELMNPENVKMRRYLYRQAYLASLPKEEKERRSKQKQEYLKELRNSMSEEKREKLREKNRQWRMNLSGEKREKYIERVYSAIRKRNERLKYERLGLNPPEELLPIRKGRNSGGRGGVKRSEGEDPREGEGVTGGEVGIALGRGRRGRGRAPNRFGICHRKAEDPVPVSSSSSVATTSSGITTPYHPYPSVPTTLNSQAPVPHDFLHFLAQPPHQLGPDFGATIPVPPTCSIDFFPGQQGHPFQHLYQPHEYLPPFAPIPVMPPIPESSPCIQPPLSTPPFNYSVRDRDRQFSEVSHSLQHAQPSHNHNQDDNDNDSSENDDEPSSPPQYYQDNDDSLSNPEKITPSTSTATPDIPVSSKLKNNLVHDKSVKTASLTASYSSSSSAPEICEECGMQFARSYDLRKHINFAHNEDEGNRSCPVCGKEFNLPRSLWRHIVRHHRGNTDASKETKPKRPTRVSHDPCKCELCGKEFNTGDIRKAYRDHMRRTHKRKQEQPASSELPKPKGPHPKTVKCEFCDKEMLYISIRRHIRNAHRSNDAKSFACEECGKCFKERRYLTDHVRLTHSFNIQKMIESRKLLAKSYSKEDPGKEIFTCTICSENISERLQFRTHLLKKHPNTFQEISSSGEPFSKRECEVCKASFSKEIELKEHLTAEHPDICWSCPHCAKFYCVQASLQKHIKNIHTLKKSKDSNEENGKKCPKCQDFIEGGEPEMWDHIKALHKEMIVYCRYCGKPKWSKKLLSDHHRICRLKPPKNPEDDEDESNKLTCNVCGSKLKHQDSLDRHMRDIHKIHKTEYKCDESDCEEVFAQKGKLNDHLEKAHGVRVKRKNKAKKRKESPSPSPPPTPEEHSERRRRSKRNRRIDMEELESDLEDIDLVPQLLEVKVERFEDVELHFYLKTEPE